MISAAFQYRLWERMARTIAHLTQAPIVLVVHQSADEISLLAMHGYEVTARDHSWLRQILSTSNGADQLYLSDLRRRNRSGKVMSAAKRNYSCQQPIPSFISSAVVVPIALEPSGGKASILICDPQQKWPFGTSISFMLMEVSQLVAEFLDHHGKPASVRALPAPKGLYDKTIPGLSEARDTEPASRFLTDTLVKRRALKSRNGISYLTVRAWREALKTYQMQSLQASKDDPPATLVKLAADEIAEVIAQLHGDMRFAHVVPVPCGHSRRERCLSVLLAEAIGELLKVEVLLAFESVPRPGKSHPIKSAKLEPFRWQHEPKGPVLLVDDVVTSGKHIELAVRQLREKVAHVTAVAWIGP